MARKLVVWVSDRAGEASRALQALKKHREAVARNAAVLIRERTGEVLIYETGNVDLEHGPLLGVITGLLVELLAGSDLERVAVQAASIGLTQEDSMQLSSMLEPGGSALVTLVDAQRIEGILKLLSAFQGHVWQQTLADDLLARLSSGLASEGR
jgi:uncharacterized membrane protein